MTRPRTMAADVTCEECEEIIRNYQPTEKAHRLAVALLAERAAHDSSLAALASGKEAPTDTTAFKEGATEMSWQLIETAPKDGTFLLLFFPGDELDNPAISIGWWTKGSSVKWNPVDAEKELWHREITEPFEQFITHRGWCNPTHWMPLPDPPASGVIPENDPASSPQPSRDATQRDSSEQTIRELVAAVVQADFVMNQTTEQELRDRLQIPAGYDPNSDGANLLGRLYDASDAVTLRHLFKRMAWTLLNREKQGQERKILRPIAVEENTQPDPSSETK